MKTQSSVELQQMGIEESMWVDQIHYSLETLAAGIRGDRNAYWYFDLKETYFMTEEARIASKAKVESFVMFMNDFRKSGVANSAKIDHCIALLNRISKDDDAILRRTVEYIENIEFYIRFNPND